VRAPEISKIRRSFSNLTLPGGVLTLLSIPTANFRQAFIHPGPIPGEMAMPGRVSISMAGSDAEEPLPGINFRTTRT